LGDLHLNSISVGQLVAEAARRLGLPRPVSPTDYADATVAGVAQALDNLLQASPAQQTVEAELLPSGIDSWTRAFTVELVERSLPSQSEPTGVAGEWRVLSSAEHPLADGLRLAFASCGIGDGVVVCLPPEPDESSVGLLLESARAVLLKKEGARFVMVQHGGGAAAFARTLHLEATHATTCVVDVPQDHPDAIRWIVAEALAARRYTEAHYDSQGRRWETVIRALPLVNDDEKLPLTDGDVLVVTGGGKGITAECAFDLARATGARLGLIGLSQPETDAELSGNIQRLINAGIKFKYISADMTDALAVRAAIRKFEAELGPITGLLHGAARNIPQLLSVLDEEDFRRTLAVKVQGARNLLAAIDPERLRLFVTFGSIIARSGLPGEADYGLANEWLSRLAGQWKSEHPACRCVAVEWSIWSGVGMGARLSSLDMLAQQGITPIPPEQGVSVLRQLLSRALPAVPVIVMGRYRDMPTFKVERPELPLLRFLEQPRIYFPNVELVVDVNLSTRTDPYLNDHQLQGERLLPAVLGLEAMAQVAMALTGAPAPPIFQEVSFNRPVVVPESSPLAIRLVALVGVNGLVEVALRSEETAFQLNHFQALCRFDNPKSEPIGLSKLASDKEESDEWVALDPARDLYGGGILFHRGRFQRLSGYRLLKATECLAAIATDGTASWFSQYLPFKLVLGDPGARDAAIHAVQACIPQTTLIPIGVERVSPGSFLPLEPLYVYARERAHTDNIFTYDLCVRGADGSLREHWEGLRLRAVSGMSYQGPWTESLLVPYVERAVRELIPNSAVSVSLEREEGGQRHAQSERAIQKALGEKATVWRRSDGKPKVNGGREVSAAHTGGFTLAVAGPGLLGCDIEQVLERSAQVWQELLGENRAALARIIVRQANEDDASAATRVWAAGECMKKAGAVFDAPLLFVSSRADGWVLLSSGRFMIATYVAEVRAHESKLAMAVLVEGQDESL
jgi:enediyne polyketide synthase